jgi:transposase-like protein
MKRYSKPDYQGPRLRRMVDLAEKSVKMQAREVVTLPQAQRVDRRFSAETIAELVQEYRDGASTTHLRQRYDLSQGTVTKILHERGVEMRGQGLTDHDVPTAAELYQDGATLAQLSERFGVSPNAVRRALVSTGVVMRPRGGSKPRGH